MVRVYSFVILLLYCSLAHSVNGNININPKRDAYQDIKIGHPKLYASCDQLPKFPGLGRELRFEQAINTLKFWELYTQGKLQIVFLKKCENGYIDKNEKIFSNEYVIEYNKITILHLMAKYDFFDRQYKDLSSNFDRMHNNYVNAVVEKMRKDDPSLVSLGLEPNIEINTGDITDYPEMDAQIDISSNAPRFFLIYELLPGCLGSRIQIVDLWRLFSQGKIEVVILFSLQSGYEVNPLDRKPYAHSYIEKYNRAMTEHLLVLFPEVLNMDCNKENISDDQNGMTSLSEKQEYYRVKPDAIW